MYSFIYSLNELLAKSNRSAQGFPLVEMAALTLTSIHKGEPYPIFIICVVKCQQINLFEICLLEPNAISDESWGVDPFTPDPGDGDDALISPSPGGGSCLGKISCGISC